MHRGLNDFALRVDSNEDYGLNADFEVRARRVKLLQLGGEFTAHKATTWVIEGRFAPWAKDQAAGNDSNR